MLISRITGGAGCQRCKKWSSFVRDISATVTCLDVNGVSGNRV